MGSVSPSQRRVVFAVAIAALGGCGSGCDGERIRPPVEPHTAHTSAIVDGGAGGDAAAAIAVGAGFLDAPPGSLDAIFRAFDAAERGDPSGRALVVFFGDSHTASDSMTSRLRAQWQAKFGDAGRGLVAAGRPNARHYYQRDVRYGASGQWRSAVGGVRDPEPFGIAGLRIYGDRKGSQLWVETCADCAAGKAVAQFEVLYQAAPERGLLKYRVDDQPWQQLATKTSASEPPHPARHVIPVTEGAHRLTLEHGGGGQIDLYGVVMERLRPGVIVDSLGVVGRRLGSLRSWDWSIIGDQLATRDPRMVVLQYGTNEADDPDLDLEALARYYDETIARIRAAAPTASILILGPPDMGVREAGKVCDRMRKPPPAKKPARRDVTATGSPASGSATGSATDGAGSADPGSGSASVAGGVGSAGGAGGSVGSAGGSVGSAGGSVGSAGGAGSAGGSVGSAGGAGSAASGSGAGSGAVATVPVPVGDAGQPDVIPECRWRTPGALREIIAVEHAAAVRNRVAFFDTFAAMGGADRMNAWFFSEPRMVYKDRVHFTDAGYQKWADEFSTALLASYDRWRRAQNLPPVSRAAPPQASPASQGTPRPVAP